MARLAALDAASINLATAVASPTPFPRPSTLLDST